MKCCALFFQHFSVQWRVRHTLAASIHEIAAIIGEENADAHLVPVFEQFMKDVEDVKHGLLKHLYDFFKLSSLLFWIFVVCMWNYLHLFNRFIYFECSVIYLCGVERTRCLDLSEFM